MIPEIREAYPMQADGTDHPEKPSAAKVAAYCRELASKVAAASGEAARYYDRYVSPMLPHVQKRMFYSPRVKPENRHMEDDLTSAFCGASGVWNSRILRRIGCLELSHFAAHRVSGTLAFCGASDVWNSRLASQVLEYAVEVWTLHQSEESIEPDERHSPKIDTYEYRSNKRRDGKWLQLVPVALDWMISLDLVRRSSQSAPSIFCGRSRRRCATCSWWQTGRASCAFVS